MAKTGDTIEHPVTGERVTFLKTTADTGGALLRMAFAVRPGGFVAAPHVHPRQEERFEVRSGSLAVRIGEEERRVGPGEAAVVPAGTPHVWRNAGPLEAEFVVELRPALNAEEAFETLFGLAQDGLVDPKTGLPEQPWLALVVLGYRDFAALAEPPMPALLDLFGPIAAEAERQGYRLPYPYPYARLRRSEPQAA